MRLWGWFRGVQPSTPSLFHLWFWGWIILDCNYRNVLNRKYTWVKFHTKVYNTITLYNDTIIILGLYYCKILSLGSTIFTQKTNICFLGLHCLSLVRSAQGHNTYPILHAEDSTCPSSLIITHPPPLSVSSSCPVSLPFSTLSFDWCRPFIFLCVSEEGKHRVDRYFYANVTSSCWDNLSAKIIFQPLTQTE